MEKNLLKAESQEVQQEIETSSTDEIEQADSTLTKSEFSQIQEGLHIEDQRKVAEIRQEIEAIDPKFSSCQEFSDYIETNRRSWSGRNPDKRMTQEDLKKLFEENSEILARGFQDNPELATKIFSFFPTEVVNDFFLQNFDLIKHSDQVGSLLARQLRSNSDPRFWDLAAIYVDERSRSGDETTQETMGNDLILVSQLIFGSDRDSYKIAAEDLLGKYLTKGHPDCAPLITSMLYSAGENRTDAFRILSQSFTKLGVRLSKKEVAEMIDGWGTIKEGKSIPPSDILIRANFDEMFGLEAERPGALKTLMNPPFGLRYFARYPKEMLRRMVDQVADKSNQYILAIFPRSDYNGAFAQDAEVFESLLNQLDTIEKLTGKHINFRVIESESKQETARSLIMLERSYNAGESDNRIPGLILGGHGEPGSIQLGNGYETWKKININDANGKGVQRSVERFFAPNFTSVFISCSTGQKNGIAERFSRLLSGRRESKKTNTVAPTIPTNIKRTRFKTLPGTSTSLT